MVYNLGSNALRWRSLFARHAFINSRREEVQVWDSPTSNQVDTDNANGGATGAGGSGQIFLKVDNETNGSRAIINSRPAQANDGTTASNNDWTPSLNPYWRMEMEINSAVTLTEVFVGLRAAFGTALPAATDHHIGFKKTNAASNAWFASNGGGAATTTTSLSASIAASNRHVLEFCMHDTSIEFFVDGVLVATHTTNLPTSDLKWTIMLVVNGVGAVTNNMMTAGKLILQEDPD